MIHISYSESDLRVYEVIWKDRFAEKINDKHGVATDEVEQVLFSTPHVRLAEKGRVRGENLYFAYGQTDGSRYLIVLFVRKRPSGLADLSARYD